MRMDEKKLKKLLDKELDSLAPSMSRKVKNAPIVTSDASCDSMKKHSVDITVRKKNNRRPVVWGAVAAVLVVVIAMSVLIPVMLSGGNKPVDPVTYSAGYLQMDINPSVEIVYDKDLNVTAVKSANSDGDVLIADEAWYDSLKGKKVEDVVCEIADRAGSLGYIKTGEENALRLISVSGNEKQDEQILASVSAKLESDFMQRGIYCAVVRVREGVDYLAEKYDSAAQDINTILADVTAKADNYFEEIANKIGGDLEALKVYYEEELYNYLKDQLELECVRIKQTRELLHKAQELNDRILRYNESLFVYDYWQCIESEEAMKDPELKAMCDEMTKILADISGLRDGSVITNAGELGGLVIAYDYIIDEEWLSEIGNATIDDLKEDIVWIIDGLMKINEGLANKISAVINSVPSTVNEYIETTRSIITYVQQELEEAYSAAYEKGGEPVSEQQYDEFYANIISQYGSLEAYWQSRN